MEKRKKITTNHADITELNWNSQCMELLFVVRIFRDVSHVLFFDFINFCYLVDFPLHELLNFSIEIFTSLIKANITNPTPTSSLP